MARDELADGADGLAALGRDAGLEVLAVELVTPGEWDAYEAAYAGAVGRLGRREPRRSGA